MCALLPPDPFAALSVPTWWTAFPWYLVGSGQGEAAAGDQQERERVGALPPLLVNCGSCLEGLLRQWLPPASAGNPISSTCSSSPGDGSSFLQLPVSGSLTCLNSPSSHVPCWDHLRDITTVIYHYTFVQIQGLHNTKSEP